jgi:hypothetical protein
MPLPRRTSRASGPAVDAPMVVYGLRSGRRRAVQARQLAQAAIWLLGMAGFLGPMVLARTSPHADLLRALALGWFILFGLINGLFVARAAPRRQFRRTLDR